MRPTTEEQELTTSGHVIVVRPRDISFVKDGDLEFDQTDEDDVDADAEDDEEDEDDDEDEDDEDEEDEEDEDDDPDTLDDESALPSN
jgi:hypothetical protein